MRLSKLSIPTCRCGVATGRRFPSNVAIINAALDHVLNLVYSGYGATGGGPSHNFHVCSLSGMDNL